MLLLDKKTGMKSFCFLALGWVILGCLFSSCEQPSGKKREIVVEENGNKTYFGTIGNDSVYAYLLTNNKGLKAVISNYGGTILQLWTPDKSGNSGNIVLGYDSLSGYLQKANPYFGALIGRYANRIHRGTFTIDGKTYTLAQNNNGNTLHGGIKGFDKVIWNVNQVNDSSLALSYSSPDGEEGFPGMLTVKVIYTLTSKNGLLIDYTAISDMKTPVNLTNHTYFNLSAGKDSTILDEELVLHASQYTPVNDSLIPTGQIAPVKNTPMDFLQAKKIGKELNQVKGGYDHNFVLDKKDSALNIAAEVFDPRSGRWMQVRTTQPGIQFYTGNFLNGTLVGGNGKKIVQHGAFCLETQHFPDSPNQPSFPSTILEPGQTFHQTTLYLFSTRQTL
jgi:aldose 1-epimerase